LLPQQPIEQEDGVQAQLPLLHAWPARHEPQVVAAAPQKLVDCAWLPPVPWHRPSLPQQPIEQEDGVQAHAVPLQEVPVVQGAAQAPPLEPQAALLVPATHMPAEQQPPLQPVWFAPPQLVLHVWVLVLHVLPPGQSVARVQPQAPATQALPVRLPTQETHELPRVPQAVCACGWLPPLP
jgi:hypothetical protein